jgi:hypothetical protein
MKKRRLVFAQANDHYMNKLNYCFLKGNGTYESFSYELAYDCYRGEWLLDGIGHSSFKLELIYD